MKRVVGSFEFRFVQGISEVGIHFLKDATNNHSSYEHKNTGAVKAIVKQV